MSFERTFTERLKSAARYTLPDRMLHCFPPDFRLRNPVLSLVDQARRAGKRCALLVLTPEGALSMLETYSASWMAQLRESIREALQAVWPTLMRGSELIAMDNCHEEFRLYAAIQEPYTLEQLASLVEQLADEVERQLEVREGIPWGCRIRLLAGCSVLSPAISDTDAAIRSAVQHALTIAHGRLPADFSATHMQLLDLIRERNIRVLAQPIMDLSTGEVSGWEFLTRGPEHTPFYNPEALFAYAHQAGLLPKLELVVCEQVCKEITRCHTKETVFLNVTAVSLCDAYFAEQFIRLLRQYPQVEANRIVLEVGARRQVPDVQRMADTLAKYRSLGFRFAIDDSGVGLFTMQAVSGLVPDAIKIERSLIRNIDTVEVKQVMLRTLLFMAQHIDCQLVAAGVERQEEACVLYDHQVALGQGHYFAKPAPLASGQEQSWLQTVKHKITVQRRPFGMWPQ